MFALCSTNCPSKVCNSSKIKKLAIVADKISTVIVIFELFILYIVRPNSHPKRNVLGRKFQILPRLRNSIFRPLS